MYLYGFSSVFQGGKSFPFPSEVHSAYGVPCYKSSLNATQHIDQVSWFPDMRGFWTGASAHALCQPSVVVQVF